MPLETHSCYACHGILAGRKSSKYRCKRKASSGIEWAQLQFLMSLMTRKKKRVYITRKMLVKLDFFGGGCGQFCARSPPRLWLVYLVSSNSKVIYCHRKHAIGLRSSCNFGDVWDFSQNCNRLIDLRIWCKFHRSLNIFFILISSLSPFSFNSSLIYIRTSVKNLSLRNISIRR